jgi:adenylate cyclase
MANEVELKLSLPASAQRALLRHPLLRRAATRHATRLVNLYYDTPDLALRGHGVALRLRRQGKDWLQTIKCAGRSAAGLTTRPEWEDPYGGHFDFTRIDDPKLREWLTKARRHDRLSPLFETNFTRTTWRFEAARGTVVLVMLDRGWIASGGRREEISELELELQTGSVDHIFRLALELADRLPLAPALLSKAERGYRLFRNDAPAPQKALPVALDRDMAPLDAFRAIALGCLEHLQHNHHGAVALDDPEYIHQMRVAARRLRAALRVFRPLLPAGFEDRLVPPLHELMVRLGAARDRDVLLAEIAEPVLRALPDEPRLAALVGVITEERFRAHGDAVTVLRAPPFGRLMLLATAMLHQDLPAAAGPATAGLMAFARTRLRRLDRRVARLADAAHVHDPASLHALRIGIKRLRYALEFFAPLLAKKSLPDLLRQLAAMQDTLGQLNDLANAGRLLMDCAGGDPRLREAVTLIGGWHGPRHAHLLAGIRPGLQKLRRSVRMLA